MLSRVADSLYWMGRYFERADNCARAIEATHSLMLNRVEFAHDQRWYRALTGLGLPADARDQDPQVAIGRLAADRQTRASIVACIAAARENASQVREEISSEMWERLNRLFHEVAQSEVDPQDAAAVMRLVSLVREGSYSFHGATESTMSHGEGWRFVHLGKFTERACAVSLMLDAYFSIPTKADDLDWVTLLTSCAAFESYCRVFTADLQPERIAKFLLVHPEFPYSVRYAVDRMDAALEAIVASSSARKRAKVERIIGRLRASLAFTPMAELMAGDLHAFLNGVLEQCAALHLAVHEAVHRLSDRAGLRELMFYAIRHLTRYRYNRPVWQSMMEVRMHPISEATQRCFTFRLQVNPRARIFTFQDHLGNQVHHFDLPQHHRELAIVADALVNIEPPAAVPESLPGDAWARSRTADCRRRSLADADAEPLRAPRRRCSRISRASSASTRPDGRDPLTLVHDISRGIHRAFAYVRKSTAVNSPIEASLELAPGRLPGLRPHHDRDRARAAASRAATSAATSITATSTTTDRRTAPRTPGSRR